jgi:hypothetical protein
LGFVGLANFFCFSLTRYHEKNRYLIKKCKSLQLSKALLCMLY